MKLNKFQMLEFNSWKGITKETHLGRLFQSQPQKATDLMIQLLASYRGNSLETYLRKLPVKTFETDDEYTWEVIGSSRRNIPLIEARTIDGTVVSGATPMVGANQEPFYLVFGEDWFGDGEVVVGEKNEIYPLIILGPARMEGTYAVYKVELMGGNSVGMPYDELMLGKKFSWEYAPVEKSFSRGVGTVRYTSPIAMRNEWSRIRIKSEIGGSMLNKKLAVGIPVIDSKGQKVVHNMWMHHEDFKVEETFSEYKNNLLMYGRSNRNANGEYLNIGKSGEVISMGAGVREQMEYGNTMFFNVFRLKLVEDALHELSSAKLGFGERRFVLRTGERGATAFHKEVLNTVSGWSVFNYFGGNGNVATVTKTSSELHTNALSAGFQFTEYKAPNGAIISIEVDPMYDDPVRNKIMHPAGGVAMSYRYDIMYIGTMEVPNIQLAKLANNEEYRGYQWGFRNPYTGQAGNPYMSFDEDKAVLHRFATLGAFIIDPSRTMSLIPNLLG